MQISSSYKVLIVEDEANERASMQRLLQNAGYQVSTADSADKAMGYLDEAIDFVLTDVQMGDVSGLDLLRHWKVHQPLTGFLIITGQGSVNCAIEAIRAGAYHYVTKPIDPQALLVLLEKMVHEREQARELDDLRNRLEEKYSLNSIIGKSPPMQQVFELIRRSAQAFSTVLILGESGTGKELVAQAIHQNSPRRAGPFNAVNCSAMPATLVESELFGHEKGAFTGADQRRLGRFEAASGGTLFIDEIGDFDIALQAKLLRVLETRVVTPVGGNNEKKVDTRVLSATSRDIRAMMARGQFREDLYYRLNVVTIELPPLRQRLDDVPLLVKKFMDRVNEQNGTKITGINANVIDALQQYHWPGNVRELLNIVERMMVLSDKPTVEIDDLPTSIRKGEMQTSVSMAVVDRMVSDSPHPNNVPPKPPANGDQRATLTPTIEETLATMNLADLEQLAIVTALRRFNNNRTSAAHALGISVRTLRRKLGPKGAGASDEGEGKDEALAATTDALNNGVGVGAER